MDGWMLSDRPGRYKHSEGRTFITKRQIDATMQMSGIQLLSVVIILPCVIQLTAAFSALGGGVGLDRFRSTCPADESCIRQFDASIVETVSVVGAEDTTLWVAVYRSNQNQPSVFVRDEFFHAMNAATSGSDDSVSNGEVSEDDNKAVSSASMNAEPISDKLETPMALEKPVAVGCLRKSLDFDNSWVMESHRCALKKEDVDDLCDGGSEYLEALSIGIDSLMLSHLQQQDQQSQFEGAVRTKSTLFSNKLFEARGFAPVEELSKDMATHVSSLDGCLESYAARSVDTSLNSGARDRALQIVSLLGQLDRHDQLQTAEANKSSGDEDDDEDFDPWANLKMQI